MEQKNASLTALAIESVTNEVLSRIGNPASIVIDDIAAKSSDAPAAKRDFVMSVCGLIATTIDIKFADFVGGIILSVAAKAFEPVEAVSSTIDMIVTEGFSLANEVLTLEQKCRIFADGPTEEKETFLKDLSIACILTLVNDDSSFLEKFTEERTEFGEFGTKEPEKTENTPPSIPSLLLLALLGLPFASNAEE